MAPAGAGRPRRTWTFAELRDDVERVAHGLLRRFQPGEHVAVWAANSPHPVVLPPVSSEDAMTADWTRLPCQLLAGISTRTTTEVPGVNRVVLDVTSKPPGIITWE